MNRPLQVYMAAEDLARLEAWSSQRGWTKSQAVRFAVRALTRSTDPRERDSLLAASGMVEGLPADLSAHFERYLEETFVAKTRAPKGSRKRRPTRANLRR
jgi:hypothetical protein